MWLLKSIIQAGALNGIQNQKVLHALASILEMEGLPGLCRGLCPSCMKVVSVTGFSFMCYEACKRILIKHEELVLVQLLQGKMESVQPIGAFADFGVFTDGLVHGSRISDNYIEETGNTAQSHATIEPWRSISTT